MFACRQFSKCFTFGLVANFNQLIRLVIIRLEISNCVLQNQTEIRGNLSEIVRNLANSDKNVNFDKDTNSNKDVNSSKDVMQIPTRLLIAITY